MPQQLDDLVFDRTPSDVNRVQTLTQKLIAGTATNAERQEWLAGMKGSYNFTDLNRVGEAVEYLESVLDGLGYHISVSPKTDWSEGDFPLPDTMETYLRNIQRLRAHLPFVAPDAPASMAQFGYQQANNIEEILHNLEQALIAMQEAFLLKQANTLFMISGGVFNV